MTKSFLPSQSRDLEEETGLELVGRLTGGKLMKTVELDLPGIDRPIRAKDIIEICGPENVGKSQLLYTACAKCLMPEKFGGLGLGVVFVDSELKFSIYRLVSVLETRINNQSEETESSNIDIQSVVKECLSRFWKVRIESSDSFVHVFDHLDELLLKKSPIFLVCIDSISAFYWLDRDFKSMGRLHVLPFRSFLN